MDIHTAKCYRKYHAKGTFHYRNEEVLDRLSLKTIKRYIWKPIPYEPGKENPNEIDVEMEVDAENRSECKRRGNWDRKLGRVYTTLDLFLRNRYRSVWN